MGLYFLLRPAGHDNEAALVHPLELDAFPTQMTAGDLLSNDNYILNLVSNNVDDVQDGDADDANGFGCDVGGDVAVGDC